MGSSSKTSSSRHKSSKRSKILMSPLSSSSSGDNTYDARAKTVKHKSKRRQKDRTTADLLKVQSAKSVISDNVAIATAAVTTNSSRRYSSKESIIHSSKTKVEKQVQIHIEQRDISDDVEVIDLCTPVMASTIETTDNLAQLSLDTMSTSGQTSYTPRTLMKNSGRHLILPAFPAAIENNRPHLLLANVPDHLLSDEQRKRRYSSKARPPFLIVGAPPNSVLVDTKIPSLFWPIYQQIFGDVSEHLHVDMSIIDYNYARLTRCIDIWAKEKMIRFKSKPHDVALDQREYAIALEFYLQIDVDLFYMKTCSFGNVQPQQPNKYLFCSIDPQARHEMTACGNCGLCYPKYDVKKRPDGRPPIVFGIESRRHQFVSKYETILNCPCTCQTSNIIYVLTCPCGKYDYIGETGVSLAARIEAHRWHANRIMHEAFLGQKNIKLAYPDYTKSAEILSKDDMQLYRHLKECRLAIQMFLDINPRYWRFVPMTNEEAKQPKQTIPISSLDIKAADDRDDKSIKEFINSLPTPPASYEFSMRQYHQQYAFFKSRRDMELPNCHLDLYDAKVIAVLPEGSSTVLRQFIESLFITHAQTKLNSSGCLVGNEGAPVVSDTLNHQKQQQQHAIIWCESLVRRPSPAFITATGTKTTVTTDNMPSSK